MGALEVVGARIARGRTSACFAAIDGWAAMMRFESIRTTAGVGLLSMVAAGCSSGAGEAKRASPSAGPGPAVSASVAPVATSVGSAARGASAPSGMVLIPAGSFRMGRDDGKPWEAPAHEVKVEAFYLDVNEVTLDEYEACVRAGKCPNARASANDKEFCNGGKADRRNHPVNCIGFKSAGAYCASVGKRLPTEAEWERAARGDDGRLFPWGNEKPNQDLLCFARLQEKLGTCEVGKHDKGNSPFGVHDMAGNVSEWTSTPYCRYDDPQCKTEAHVARGGSWDYTNPANLTATGRTSGDPDNEKDLVGVRCAKDGPK